MRTVHKKEWYCTYCNTVQKKLNNIQKTINNWELGVKLESRCPRVLDFQKVNFFSFSKYMIPAWDQASPWVGCGCEYQACSPYCCAVVMMLLWCCCCDAAVVRLPLWCCCCDAAAAVAGTAEFAVDADNWLTESAAALFVSLKIVNFLANIQKIA